MVPLVPAPNRYAARDGVKTSAGEVDRCQDGHLK
jgi:hypothetical protein